MKLRLRAQVGRVSWKSLGGVTRRRADGRAHQVEQGNHDLWQLLIVPSANPHPFPIIEIPIFYCHCFLFIIFPV